MEMIRKTTLKMHTLLLCADAQFLGTTRSVLSRLQVEPHIVSNSAAALEAIGEHAFDAIIVDWREIDNLAEFLCAVRRSELNPQCVLVAIVRDLLDLQQAFAAGVQLLIHKPASTLQIERCLRAAYCARVAQRRKQHREPVEIVVSVSTHTQPFVEAVMVNLSEGGAALRQENVTLSAGEEVDLRFALPGNGEMLDVAGTVVWATPEACGLKFRYIPERQRSELEQWLTDCVERSLAELCERLRDACA